MLIDSFFFYIWSFSYLIPPDELFGHKAWKKYGNWKQLLEPLYRTAASMMGRTLYEKIDPEERHPRKVAKDMDRADSFENAYVGVYLDE